MNGGVFLFLTVAALLGPFDVLAFPSNKSKPLRYEVTGPQKCCLPNQYSTQMIVLNTATTGNMVRLAMQMDYDRKQQVMLNYTGGSPDPVYKVLIDFEKKMLYSVPTKYPSYCYKIPYTMPLIKCIPDDAEYIGSSFLGPMGSGELDYDGWRMNLNNMKVALALTSGSCVPVAEQVSIPNGPDQFYLFSQFEPKLTDPSQFQLPKSCL